MIGNYNLLKTMTHVHATLTFLFVTALIFLQIGVFGIVSPPFGSNYEFNQKTPAFFK